MISIIKNNTIQTNYQKPKQQTTRRQIFWSEDTFRLIVSAGMMLESFIFTGLQGFPKIMEDPDGCHQVPFWSLTLWYATASLGHWGETTSGRSYCLIFLQIRRQPLLWRLQKPMMSTVQPSSLNRSTMPTREKGTCLKATRRDIQQLNHKNLPKSETICSEYTIRGHKAYKCRTTCWYCNKIIINKIYQLTAYNAQRTVD